MSIKIDSEGRKKKRVLLIWFEMPRRPELLEPFINLSEKFEFIHLYFNTPGERKGQEISPFEVIYWFDYSTPYKLLNEIRPEIIVSEFPMSLQWISLNVAAKNLHIPYISMTHGIYFADTYKNIDMPGVNSVFHIKRYYHYYKVLLFYISCIKKRNAKDIKHLFRFLLCLIRRGWFYAVSKVKFELRCPDKYIVYQLKNTEHAITERHNFPKEKIVAIGVPQFDTLFRYWESHRVDNSSVEDYYLMIDTAWIYQNDLPPTELVYSTYLKLAGYCKSQNCKLYIKLHPYWYDKQDFPVDENIVYIRDIAQKDLAELIIEAKGCFLYFSTLSIPIVPYKNCYFLYYRQGLKDLVDIIGLGVAKSLNIEELEINSIVFDKWPSRTFNNKYIEDYLYSIDGHATERLGKIIASESL